MGGCVSRPKELDGYKTISGKKSAEKEVTVKPDKGGGDPPAEEAKAESVTKPENKQEPLIDLSESKPEAEKSDATGLHPEMSGLTVNAPETVESSASKQDVLVEGQATVNEQKAKMVEEKDEETKGSFCMKEKW